MATKVGIINEALVHLGQPPMAGPSDNSTWVKRLTNIYPASVRRLLERHSWNFAKVMEQLQALPTATGGRDYSYNKPAKALSILKINDSGLEEDDEWDDYDDADGKIHADQDVLYMWFVSSDYLIKEGSWPQVFAHAVAVDLAAQCAPVGTKDINEKDRLEKKARKAFNEAKSWDAGQKPFRKNPRGQWAIARRTGARCRTDG
jgi:hypothetical protein